MIDLLELVLPSCIIQELSQIKPIVVGTIVFAVVSGRQYGTLVSIDGIKPKKLLDLLSNLSWSQTSLVLPMDKQVFKHRKRTLSANLS